MSLPRKRRFAKPLGRSFYARDVLEVAPACIGKLLVHETPDGVLAGRIVETEAYRGPEDRAAHSYGGRRTTRTEAMFGPPGHAYVFFVYGMHWHVNLVTSAPGMPHAVLIRAVEPVAGAEFMAARRHRNTTSRDLTNGPGKLCKALGIDGALYGCDLTRGPLYLAEPRSGSPVARISRSPRIGIDYAGAFRDRPWRYFETQSPYVSRRSGGR